MVGKKDQKTMITGAYFKDDHDYDLQNQQHECYREVLGLIVDRCVTHYIAAERITGRDKSILSKKFGQNNFTFDHRILQPIHDLMAAYWRWLTGRHEPHMPGLEPNCIEDWKLWVRAEIDDWTLYAPEIIRGVIWSLDTECVENKGFCSQSLIIALKKRYRCMHGTQ